jgi:hypothetical protein
MSTIGSFADGGPAGGDCAGEGTGEGNGGDLCALPGADGGGVSAVWGACGMHDRLPERTYRHLSVMYSALKIAIVLTGVCLQYH